MLTLIQEADYQTLGEGGLKFMDGVQLSNHYDDPWETCEFEKETNMHIMT